ncbi:PREDICTED: uncharacterized protein LOC105952933 [Erythranthe guttata]|uniref:uncharacterized protein LOC105952933 n=1 Tax=Erythranthe guttata TaxID=4155 RepID=UPI00064DF194|nr:PREDICTED: uncharacterized protein LOC105952933 [Erythranthe guttata]XP_012832101.1 PREDICTED: uncharacterized protein LOC105952933 [Erythranthe guttata]XP_012832176.1 PREDICTED: uncharacterized protein LOC105952933 [Erythranthe guttata]|eukprot:XP_012832024.1 PREDICTED: uncharacterized protein LOC105952933 [Erythranthe guttata]
MDHEKMAHLESLNKQRNECIQVLNKQNNESLQILNSQNKDHLLVLIRQQQELTEAVHKLFDSTAPPRQNHNQNDEINPDMNVNLQQPVQPLNLSLPEEELPQGVNRNHEQLNVNQELTAMPLTLSPEDMSMDHEQTSPVLLPPELGQEMDINPEQTVMPLPLPVPETYQNLDQNSHIFYFQGFEPMDHDQMDEILPSSRVSLPPRGSRQRTRSRTQNTSGISVYAGVRDRNRGMAFHQMRDVKIWRKPLPSSAEVCGIHRWEKTKGKRSKLRL